MIITEILVLDKKNYYAIDPPLKAGDRACSLSGSEIGDGISERVEDVIPIEAGDVHITSPPLPDPQQLLQNRSRNRHCWIRLLS